MDARFVEPLVLFLQTLSAEVLSLFLLFVCFGAIILLFRFYGRAGLYVYNAVAVIAANIQVLKCSHFTFIEEPLALGTVVFATTYLVSDILTEAYGKVAAVRGIWLSFGAQILLTLLMLITLGYKPIPHDPAHNAMGLLFLPSLRLLFASLFAFVISQFLDIWIFQRIREATKRRYLWFRALLSFLFSGLADNFLFSVLAWNVLSPTPLSMGVITQRYVLGTYSARILVAIASLPVMYYCRSKKASPLGLRSSRQTRSWDHAA